jgi:hypothetical protein
MPAPKIAALRAGVAAAAPGLIYRGGHDASTPPDAIEILVGRMRALSLVAGKEEEERYSRQRREAREDARPQSEYEAMRGGGGARRGV